MTDSIYNTPTRIKINCPYCWGEFSDFQQIDGRIRYQNKVYDDFLILPIENANSLPNYVNKRKFIENQEIKPIHCNFCTREYSLALVPFERKNENRIDLWANLQNKYNYDEIPSLLEKLIPCDFNETSLIKNALTFKYFVLINFFMYIAIFSAAATRNQLTAFSILGVLFTEMLLVVGYFWYNLKLRSSFEIEAMPLLLHNNYLISNSFRLFKKHFFNFKMKKYYDRKKVSPISFIAGIALIIVFIFLNYSSLLQQPIGLILLSLIGLGLFFWLFCLILFNVVVLLLNFLEYSTIIFTKIPLFLDPWEYDQKINIFKNLWIWSLGLFLFSSVGVEFFLNLSQINNILKDIISAGSVEPLLNVLQNNILGLIFIFITAIVVLIFILILRSFDSNIKRRKNEVRRQIKDELEKIKEHEVISSDDIFNGISLTNKIRMIDEIPLFFWKFSTFALLVETLTVMIFFATPILAIILR